MLGPLSLMSPAATPPRRSHVSEPMANGALHHAEADGLVTLARACLALKDPSALAARAGAT